MESNIIKQNGKRYRVTIVEEVEPEIEWDYLSGHKASGLKVGHKVKVLRAFENNEGGCYIVWVGEKERLIGVECEITSDAGLDGFRLKDKLNNHYFFPYFVLEKVEEPAKKEVKSYDDVLDELQPKWQICIDGSVNESNRSFNNHYPSKEKAEQFYAKTQLENVATYLNEDEFKDVEWEFVMGLSQYNYLKYVRDTIMIDLQYSDMSYGSARFKSKEAAKRAIDILGEETIKMALK